MKAGGDMVDHGIMRRKRRKAQVDAYMTRDKRKQKPNS
jgi:hypothetical protein